MSGIDTLNIVRDSLLSHQTAINLTGTNISNVDTPGYSRQRALFNTLGQSVEISGIERMYDQFLGVQINEQAHSLGGSEAKKDALGRIETIFNEADGGGINELLNRFWGAWDDLSVNPSGQAERMTVVSVSQSLASLFRSYGDDLLAVQEEANARISSLVDQVNSYVSDIADINYGIMQSGGSVADSRDQNTLRDSRDKLLSDLAKVVDFHYVTNADDSISVFLSNGMTLADGARHWDLDVVADGQTALYNVVFENDPTVVINSSLTSGSLAACLEVRDVTVTGYLESLNTLAATLAAEVNARHELGYDLNQNVGGAFFFFDVDPEVQEARYLKVSADILSDVNKIAASATVNGDGGNAVSMSEIQNTLTMNSGTSTFSAYYSSLVGQVGQDVAYGNRSVDHHTSLLMQLTNKREEISGVSIDEEMMNLIKYQTVYNASARLFTAAEELADTLMGMVQ